MASPLLEVTTLFFRLGLTAFGGPAAHIAMMEDEVVTRRKWMTREHFLDLVGATSLIPGPNSTEMALHCGKERAGWPGLLAAGAAFLLPACSLTLLLAWVYVRFGEIPAIAPFFAGIRPAVLVIIIGAILKLGNKALKTRTLQVVGVLVVAAALLDISEIVALLTAGLACLLIATGKSRGMETPKSPVLFMMAGATSAGAVGMKTITTGGIFLSFLKIGSILFGSGYVLIAYLEDELIHRLGWLTAQELLDAVAMGQFTPGPVLSTATFVGYQVGGLSGAAAATLGIFLPSFVFVAMLNPLIPVMRKSIALRGFLDGVNTGAVGIMIAVALTFGRDLMADWRDLVVFAMAGVMVWKFPKTSSVWLVLGGSSIGYLLRLTG